MIEEEKVEEKLTPCFNDYDIEYAENDQDLQNTKNNFKLSSKMQELKEKIASRATSVKKNDFLNKYPLKNISVSFRHARKSCSLDKSGVSRNSSKLKNIKDKLYKTYLDNSK